MKIKLDHHADCAYMTSEPMTGDEASLCNCGAVMRADRQFLRAAALMDMAVETGDEILCAYANVLNQDPRQFDEVVLRALRALAENRRYTIDKTAEIYSRTMFSPAIVIPEGGVDFTSLDLSPGGVTVVIDEWRDVRSSVIRDADDIYFMDFLRSLRRRLWMRGRGIWMRLTYHRPKW